jgi:hypothetical protein
MDDGFQAIANAIVVAGVLVLMGLFWVGCWS